MAAAAKPLPAEPGQAGYEPGSFIEALQHCWLLGVSDIRTTPEAVSVARNRRATIERTPIHRWR